MASYTSSSLTLRALLKSATSRLGMDAPAARVTGLTPAAKAMFAAAAAGRDRTIFIAPTDREVELLTADARFFFAALEGLEDAELERAVLPFPSHEVDPYRGLTPQPGAHSIGGGDGRQDPLWMDDSGVITLR